MAVPNGFLAEEGTGKALPEDPTYVDLDPMTGDPSVEEEDGETLLHLFRRFSNGIFHANEACSLSHRLRNSLADSLPRVQRSCTNSGREILRWTQRGSPLRALLVISVGTVSLISLIGLAVFILFFVVATLNAIIISILMSVAAVGWLLALFLSCLVVIYIGALFVAAFIISLMTISAITLSLLIVGWVGFTWAAYLVAKKGTEMVKQYLSRGSSMVRPSTPGESQRHESKVD